MVENPKEKNYGLVIFPSGTPRHVKIRRWMFFAIFCVIIFMQAFYWLFANSAEPIVLGLPWGMFFVTLLIVIEFVVLVLMYFESLDELDSHPRCRFRVFVFCTVSRFVCRTQTG